VCKELRMARCRNCERRLNKDFTDFRLLRKIQQIKNTQHYFHRGEQHVLTELIGWIGKLCCKRCWGFSMIFHKEFDDWKKANDALPQL